MWYIVYRYSMIERDSEVSNVVYCVPVRYDIVGGEGRPPFCIPSLSSSSLPHSPFLTLILACLLLSSLCSVSVSVVSLAPSARTAHPGFRVQD